jgi:cation diffusion facilitator CzcD-associated flavoprotein CzcO
MAPRTYDVIIIGSGFGGQAAALALRKRGITDFIMLERRDFLGGTWCQNTYPGAAVDVPSPLYSIAGEPYPWSQLYADQAELRDYTEHLLAKHGLDRQAITGAEVVDLEWCGDAWQVRTAERGSYRARFVIDASGPLSNPWVPPFPGREAFAGDAFHSNAWDHTVDYRGKRVAVVGTGASAAQVIPALQPEVAQLHVFQRTPHWVMPRPDRHFTPRQRRMVSSGPGSRALRSAIYWSFEGRVLGFRYSETFMRVVARNSALRHLQDQIQDPDLRARLTPDYEIGCKRIILSNTLYPALAAENTTLHDRSGGIDRLDATGIVTSSGAHVDLDVIIWATGFDATDGMTAYPVVGRDGRLLSKTWDPFPRAYLGTAVPGYPNFFLITGPNTGTGHTSAVFMIESQLAYITRAIEAVRSSGATAIEVTPKAEGDYTRRIQRALQRTVWVRGGCASWYQSESGRIVAMYPDFSFRFRLAAKRFRPEHHVLL